MKYRILLILLAVLFLAPALVHAQTATATATPTPTPTATVVGGTPTPVPATPTPQVLTATPIPPPNSVTHFGYVGTNSGTYLGGRVIKLKASQTLSIGQVVKADIYNANSVVPCVAGDTAPIGVVVGTRITQFDNIGQSPAAGQVALIQVNGVVDAIAEGSITEGAKLMVGGAVIVGSVTTYSAGTVDEQIGVALTTTTAAGQTIAVLLYK